MNIHEAVVAFIYCNRQVPPAGATRLTAPVNAAHDDANTAS